MTVTVAVKLDSDVLVANSDDRTLDWQRLARIAKSIPAPSGYVEFFEGKALPNRRPRRRRRKNAVRQIGGYTNRAAAWDDQRAKWLAYEQAIADGATSIRGETKTSKGGFATHQGLGRTNLWRIFAQWDLDYPPVGELRPPDPDWRPPGIGS